MADSSALPECENCLEEIKGKAYTVNDLEAPGSKVCKDCAQNSFVPLFQTALKNELEFPPSE